MEAGETGTSWRKGGFGQDERATPEPTSISPPSMFHAHCPVCTVVPLTVLLRDTFTVSLGGDNTNVIFDLLID